jgi:hypothetical protein
MWHTHEFLPDNTIHVKDGSRYNNECKKKIIIFSTPYKKLQNEVVYTVSCVFIFMLYQHTLSKSYWCYGMWNIH